MTGACESTCESMPFFKDFVMESGMFSDIANRVYQDVQAQQKRGNVKAGIPEGASEELERALQTLFLSKRRVVWEDVIKVYDSVEGMK